MNRVGSRLVANIFQSWTRPLAMLLIPPSLLTGCEKSESIAPRSYLTSRAESDMAWARCMSLPVCQLDCAAILRGPSASVQLHTSQADPSRPDCVLVDKKGRLFEVFEFERSIPGCMDGPGGGPGLLCSLPE